MIFGDYFAYDTGYAIKSDFRAEYPNLSKNEFNYLFDTFNSVYDIPNIFLPLINGVLAVRYGNRKMMTIFLLFIVVGNGLVWFGSTLKSWWVMIPARGFYGLGGDSLLVSQWGYVSEYFGHDRVGVALAVTTIFTGLSETVNLFISPKIADNISVDAAFAFAAILCLTALVARFFMGILDVKIKQRSIIPEEEKTEEEEEERSHRSSLCPSAKELTLPKAGYYVLLFGVLTSTSHYGYYYMASDFLQERWYNNLDPSKAQDKASSILSMASSIKTIAVLVLAPIADYYKVYNTLALASPIILTFSYAFSMFISPVVPFVLYGISEALAHISMW
eukprot:CAMPEP_0114592962 /NCGR_PEP_ID=MMETSP0125-20121206/14657_1 /TAXON_ID=485358 ORGANISM="Aristerostoma sp., Strain ATCC 50986" /NCGR_SAMPLE_ID=MMETSP0125 /ASSEMBLY_ACC=CAM_ASM_000245 /LENGTH=332 /DNA_ID=CAMNT_0001791867 /DNA_START=196 /DNA_END=1191 /DNA_ORIENTATION=+